MDSEVRTLGVTADDEVDGGLEAVSMLVAEVEILGAVADDRVMDVLPLGGLLVAELAVLLDGPLLDGPLLVNASLVLLPGITGVVTEV